MKLWSLFGSIVAVATTMGSADSFVLAYNNTGRIPKSWNKVGATIGEQFLTKSPFLQSKFNQCPLDQVTDIKVFPEQRTCVIAGTSGAAVTDLSGNVQSTAVLDRQADRVMLIPMPKNTFNYLNRGSWNQPVSLHGSDGATIWLAGNGDANDAAGGDLDKNEIPSFAIGYNGGGGITLLDSTGKVQWKQKAGNVWHIEILEPEEGSSRQIANSDVSGKISIRDASGKSVTDVTGPAYMTNFSIVRYPSKSSQQCFLSSPGGTVTIMDRQGNVVKSLDAPQMPGYADPKGVLVKLKADEPEYLAVVGRMNLWNRSILSVYDASEKIVYQEIFPEICYAVAAVPMPSGKQDALIVGGFNQVWKFGLADTKSSGSTNAP